MLASWMRLKYPHILDGAIAGSAPIWSYFGEDPVSGRPRAVGVELVTACVTPMKVGPAPSVEYEWRRSLVAKAPICLLGVYTPESASRVPAWHSQEHSYSGK